MLRRSSAPRPPLARLTPRSTGLWVVALLASCGHPAPAAAQPPTAPAAVPDAADAADAADADVLTYVPADAQLIVVLEAKALLNDPSLAPVAALLRGEDDGLTQMLRERFGLGLDDVERVAIYANLLPSDEHDPPPPTFVIRTVGPTPASDEPEATKADARTLLWTRGGPVAPAKPARSAADLSLLRTVRGADGSSAGAAIHLNVVALRPAAAARFLADGRRGLRSSNAMLAPALLRPLLAHADTVAAGLTVTDDGFVQLVALAQSPDEDAAARVLATTRAAVALARALPGLLLASAGVLHSQTALTALNSVELAADGSRTRLTATVDQSAPLLAAAALPAALDDALPPSIAESRRALAEARRAQRQRNLKQLGLAMHRYHSTYKRFPPATIVEDGVKRSWRVELLPFLNHDDLGERYDKTKPWDDPANAAVLAEMPDVFRHPADGRAEPFTSYFAVLGTPAEGSYGRSPTAWLAESSGGGFGLRDLRDGTDNTILVVEAKRPVPWTKPEDLVYDAALPADEAAWIEPLGLGGFTPGLFQVVTGDGEVHALPNTIDPATLRALFTRAGGETVALPPEAAPAPPVAP